MKRKNILTFVMLVVVLAIICIVGSCASTSAWDVGSLDIARDSSLSKFEKDFILELNKIRTNPAKYAMQYQKGGQRMHQGFYFYLRKIKPLPPLVFSEDLSKSAEKIIDAFNNDISFLKTDKTLNKKTISYNGIGMLNYFVTSIIPGAINHTVIKHLEAGIGGSNDVYLLFDPENRFVGLKRDYMKKAGGDVISVLYSNGRLYPEEVVGSSFSIMNTVFGNEWDETGEDSYSIQGYPNANSVSTFFFENEIVSHFRIIHFGDFFDNYVELRTNEYGKPTTKFSENSIAWILYDKGQQLTVMRLAGTDGRSYSQELFMKIEGK